MTDLYYKQLSKALTDAGICTPTLIVDKERFNKNIDLLTNTLSSGFDYRIVAKSLPSIPMLQHIMRRAGTVRLMSFHLPFLMELIQQVPAADILMGKPMPLAAAKHFYAWYQQQASLCFAPELQLQWLIDSPERAEQYEQLAKELNTTIRISLEVDIGLHRGGFKPDSTFVQLLKKVHESPHLSLGGLMGYDAHISKIPAFLGGLPVAFQSTRSRYKLFTDLIRSTLGDDALKDLCLNTGGSSTYSLYDDEHDDIVANEIATASALVKPTDFDVPTLEKHLPAAFIAAPVLKRIEHPEIPEAPKLSALLRLLGLLPKAGCYIYGGNWLATPSYPKSAKISSIFGRSSNQEFYELPASSDLKVDDFMFFRPTQSEAIFLQFGHIAVYDNGKISDWWSVFDHPEGFPMLTNSDTIN